jgi:ligand-binding sensor domain-containing protein/signal transduction histidine kinase
MEDRSQPKNMAKHPILRLPPTQDSYPECQVPFAEARERPARNLSLVAFIFIFSLLVTARSQQTFAQEPTPFASNYIRTDFTVEDGLPDNVVNAIFQADNGLLWVGTESGLATFDGREFKRVRLSFPGVPSQGSVHVIAEALNGDLWVGTDAGLVRIPKTDLHQLDTAATTFFPLGEVGSDEVVSLLETRQGTLWVGTNHALYRLDAGRFVRTSLTGHVVRLAEASNGHLLIVTERGFSEFDGQKVIEHPGFGKRFGIRDDQIFNVSQDRSGTMWYATNGGTIREGDHPFAAFRPYAVASSPSYRTFEDPGGEVWVSTRKGTYRVNGNHLDALAPGIGARCFYASPDGEVWMGTNGVGLIHFKPRIVHMFTKADGLPADITMTVLTAHDGKLWIGSNCGGLSLLEGNHFRLYNEKDGLSNSCVWSLAEDHNGDLWIGTYGGGLFRFHDGQFAQYSMEQGLVDKIVSQITVAQDNSLWIATPDGLSHMEKGRFTNYTTAQGLSSNRILGVHQDHQGTIWVASQAGVDRLTANGFIPLPSQGLEEGTSAVAFAEDSMGDLYTAISSKGIGLIKNDRLLVVDDDLNVMNMVESPDHDLWFSSKNGLVRIALKDLRGSVTDHDAPLDYGRFDRADGLNSTQSSTGIPNIAITPDHKLWIATVKGLAMVDLKRLPTTSRKPFAFLGEVTVERKTQPAGNELVLPAGTHHVELHLAAVDLASPEKTRVQYRMDGVDSNWRDSDVSRTAVYTTIPAGRHTFHVRATGSDGKWDRTGIVYDVVQRPLFYEEKWFQLGCAAFLLLLLTVLYLARVRHIVSQTRILLETRIAERERIARELHDTFLQGIQGILLRFHTSTQQLPKDEPLRRVFEGVLDQSDTVMLQGRGLISGLRMTEEDMNELPITFAMVGKEFRALSTATYNVIVIGETRNLNPLVQDEIIKIGREALFNSYRHAGATTIETELDYNLSELRICFRDDGKGIGPEVLANGQRAGHYGLLTMRERASNIGAKLEVYSRGGLGTEIDLRVPASIAYPPARENTGRWLQRLFQESAL